MNEIFSAAEERAVTLKGTVGSFPVTVLDLRILVKSGGRYCKDEAWRF